MILSKNTESENIVVFDDFLLRIIMGQWLGVLPSSSKKGLLLSRYKEPKTPEEFQNHKISKRKMEKIEFEFTKLLDIFGLQDETYLIQDFNQEKKTFWCHLFQKKERAFIQFDFHHILMFPSSFMVSYRGIHTKYSFVTNPNSYENILVSIDRKKMPTIREFLNLNFYKIESLECGSSMEVEYKHQLKSLEKDSPMIHYDLLYEKFEKLNQLGTDFLDFISFFGQNLGRNIDNYRKIKINWNQKMKDDIHNSVLEILNGQIERLEIGGQEADNKQKSEVLYILQSIGYEKSKETSRKKGLEIRGV